MIARKKYCQLILNNPNLLGELIKIDNGTMKPDTIIRNLQRESPNMRRSIAFIKVLKSTGLSDDEIFEMDQA